MSSGKMKDPLVFSEMEFRKMDKDRFPYWDDREIILGDDFGTRLSVNLPHDNQSHIFYEGINNKDDKKR